MEKVVTYVLLDKLCEESFLTIQVPFLARENFLYLLPYSINRGPTQKSSRKDGASSVKNRWWSIALEDDDQET
jgi:hypothetical protein